MVRKIHTKYSGTVNHGINSVVIICAMRKHDVISLLRVRRS